jgi:hypothetical protein
MNILLLGDYLTPAPTPPPVNSDMLTEDLLLMLTEDGIEMVCDD